jgi:branched-chain amino acid transport system ATP-binding protein
MSQVDNQKMQFAAKTALTLADRGYVLDVGTIAISGSSEELLASEKIQEAYLGKEH